jgi:lipopolysaccharide export system protein LptA
VIPLQNPATIKMKQAIFPVLAVFYFLLGGQCLAQVSVPFKSKNNDSTRVVYIWHSDTLRQEKKDTSSIQSLFGHVKLQQERTVFYCDSVAINQNTNIVEAFGNVHITDSDTTNIYSQYMKYFVDKKFIIFKKNVTLTDGKGVLTTEELQYDMNQRIGNYLSGGKVVNESTTITSDNGTYYAETKDVYFKKNVVLKDPAYDLKADSLLYNTDKKIATFITETYIRDSSGRTIRTRDGYYDLYHHRAEFGMRPRITDGSQTIIGDNVQFDDSTGISTARGNAVFKDTAQGVAVIANLMIADRKANTLLAIEKPLMILKEDQDSIYITADTLFSGVLPDSVLAKGDTLAGVNALPRSNRNDSSTRFLQGYHHVRIFSDSVQGLADSLYYSGIDSVFRMFTDPILWASGKQITGDTIYLYTKNKKPDRLYVFENGLVVDKSGDNMYNQVKGNTLNGYFKNGEIDYMRAKGSAESVYYIKDDSMALVGVNRVTQADIIDMIFQNKELHKVVLRNDAQGTMYPIKKVNLEEMRLRNFKWLDDKRPKSKTDLFQSD